MPVPQTVLYENQLTINTAAVYTVDIRSCKDTSGYWAKCEMPNGCCYTDGETLYEVQLNMYESMDLYLEDYPEIKDYLLVFDVLDE